MQTDNLNEMIHPDLDKYVRFIEIDDPSPKDTMDHGNSNPETQIDSGVNTPEILTGSYEPDSEEALIAYTAHIHAQVQVNSITGYWEIGRSINAFYEGKYGTKELERIAQATGIGKDTLAKSCKFARQYSKEDVEILLRGRFVVSWRQISQNLTVAPQKIIEIYRQAPSREQFYNGIIKLKDPSEARGRARRSSVRETSVVKEPEAEKTSGLSSVSHDIAAGRMSPELTGSIETVESIPKDDNIAEETIKDLLQRNEQLRKQLEDAMRELNELKILFHDAAQDIAQRDDLIDRLRDTLNQVYEMIENGCNHEDILAEVEWGL